MKRITIAAGALLLGTSAFAWAPSTAPVAHEAKEAITVSAGKAPSVAVVAKSNDLPKAVQESAVDVDTGDKLVAADPDLDLSVDPDAVDKGMGGPLEEVTTTADAAPQPAAANYPPCRPGPGDDNCIQLYEPGVRDALAAWSPSTLPDTRLAAAEQASDTTLAGEMGEATGVGGPYEPAADTSETAMNGDGLIDDEGGETAELELKS